MSAQSTHIISERPDLFISFYLTFLFFLSLCPVVFTSFSPLFLCMPLAVLVVFLAQVFAFAVSEEDCDSYSIYHLCATAEKLIYSGHLPAEKANVNCHRHCVPCGCILPFNEFKARENGFLLSVVVHCVSNHSTVTATSLVCCIHTRSVQTSSVSRFTHRVVGTKTKQTNKQKLKKNCYKKIFWCFNLI